MKIVEREKDFLLQEVTDFDLQQTLECGQCFHFKCIGEQEYGIAAFGRLLHIKQEKDVVTLFDTSGEEYEQLWKSYFDFDTDYAVIKKKLLAVDDKIASAIHTMQGVHILKQEFFEVLLSFIISQNKQIPHIKQIVAAISERYGTFLGELGGERFYAFPSCERLRENATEAMLRECKTGFRAPYLMDAVEKVSTGMVAGDRLKNSTYEAGMQELMTIKGVGEKVANCVMLFGLGHTEAFPVDVWIQRIMEALYFGREASKEEIEAFAREHFGAFGGYAQQYLFYYGKENYKEFLNNIKKV